MFYIRSASMFDGRIMSAVDTPYKSPGNVPTGVLGNIFFLLKFQTMTVTLLCLVIILHLC